MNFINSIEILNLQNVGVTDINANVIKKAKRKLFADIELSDDGYFDYKGHSLTKSDCESAIDELNNNDRKEYYYQLATTLQPLNNYLVSGDENFFAHFKQESIYQLPDFINFINPFFAQNFDKSLLKAFNDNDASLLSSILRTQILVNSSNINTAFKSVRIELENRIAEIDKIKNDIKSENNDWNNDILELAVILVKGFISVDILNTLPNYFQSQINKIASSINNLQLAIDNNFGNTQIPLDLLTYLLQLNITSVGKATFENNYKIVKRRNDEKIEQEENAPVLKKWADILLQIRNATQQVVKKIVIPKKAANEIIPMINVAELNALPPFANEIREQIGYAIRGLSVSSWNRGNDINTALKLINFALSIYVFQGTKQQFETDLKDLQDRKKQRETVGEPITFAPTLRTTNGIGTTIYGSTLWFVFFGFPIMPLSRWNCQPNGRGYTFYGKLKLHIWQKVWQWAFIPCIVLWIIITDYNKNDFSYSANSYSNNSYSAPISATTNNLDTTTMRSIPPADNSSSIPVYKIVSVENGNFPDCSNINARYNKNINTRIIISTQTTDVAVKLCDAVTSECIRFVFINANTTYTINHIPKGIYYLKIAYGNDWQVKDGDPICKGHFASNASYKRDNNIYDFNIEHHDDGTYSVPYYTLKLWRETTDQQTDDNSSNTSITESDFDNN